MDTLTSTEWTYVLIGAGVLVIALLALGAARAPRARRAELKGRFGPEYDRAIEQYGSVARAERELLAREKRVQHFRLRRLSDADRTRFAEEWRAAQSRFVDDPSSAVNVADELIGRVMAARGYEVDEFEQRVADLSVGHANVVQHYRAARVLADANREGRANTEELRQAFVHYRALFSDLLDDVGRERALREAHV